MSIGTRPMVRTWNPRMLPTIVSWIEKTMSCGSVQMVNSAKKTHHAVARGTEKPRQICLRGSGASNSASGPINASAANESAMVIGETNGMSVIAWRVISAHCDAVASTSTESAAARRPARRDTICHTAHSAASDSAISGSRTAHSGRQSATI